LKDLNPRPVSLFYQSISSVTQTTIDHKINQNYFWNKYYNHNFSIPTIENWARVVGYGPFSLYEIHKEGLCPSSGDINWLMMMMTIEKRHFSGYIAGAARTIAKADKKEYPRTTPREFPSVVLSY
jgi:hypothetical protein